ncbi:MAG: ABC transporter substrate-binding protein [Methylovulum sp.]
MSERRKLFIIIASIIVLSAITSFLVYNIWFKESKHNVHVGIITSNPHDQESINNGISSFIAKIDNTKYINPKNIKVQNFSASDPQLLKNIDDFVKSNDVIGFISLTDVNTTNAVTESIKKEKAPFLNLASIDNAPFKDSSHFFSTVFNETKQAQFTANYSRNVLGLMIITIIHDNTQKGINMAKQFSDVYERFGTKIHYEFSYDTNDQTNSIEQVIANIKDKQDLGSIFFVGNAADSAKFVVKARDANIKNKIIGTDVVATHAFNRTIADISHNKADSARYTNDIIFSAPLLFDTSGSEEQRFKNSYLQRFGEYPDWISAYGHDAIKLILKEILNQSLTAGNIEKEIILKYLYTLNTPDVALHGATGDNWFDKNREAQKTTQIGVYDGQTIIAAPTQLQPIKPNSSVNYIEELKSGKMLYVIDRFMYKTNVIYTGIELHDVSKLDLTKNTAELDFSIWFRYRGNFDPADLMFINAGTELNLDKPVLSYQKDGVMFKRYRIKHDFNIDFSTEKFRHGSHVAGLSFRHKNFNKNNVIYVIDDLGMALNSNTSLKDKVNADHILQSLPDWKILAAQFYQSITVIPTFGEPMYVGYGAIGPDFSKIDYEVLLAEDRFNLNDYVNPVYFVYIGIFGILGSIAARLIDNKYNWKKHANASSEKDLTYKEDVIFFWLASSWVMRVVFWYVSLLAIGNLTIEIAIDENLSNHSIDLIVMVYDALWWMVPATLIVLALNLFLWPPMEKKSQRKIPGVIKNFTSGIIYILFFFCIVAFVFNKPLSSLLATSGLFAMILGLAVQGNIANIFSGIVVNLERPFSIGDYIKIKTFDRVQVIDMTWRSLKVKDLDNNIISIPNSLVAAAEIVNYIEDFSKIGLKLNMPQKYEPELILSHLKTALASVKGIHDIKTPEQYFNGYVYLDCGVMAEYIISFSIYEFKKHKVFRDEVWKAIFHEFTKAKIPFEEIDRLNENKEIAEVTIDLTKAALPSAT